MRESKQRRVCGVYVVDDVSVRDEICRTCRMERAAPLMLEALRDLTACVESGDDHHGALERARAAIKAATGGAE